jgi:hypothetical protein
LLLVRGRLARVGEPRCQPTRHLLNAVEHLLRIPRFVGFREQSHSSEAPRGIFDRTSDVSSGLATITFAGNSVCRQHHDSHGAYCPVYATVAPVINPRHSPVEEWAFK